MAATNMCSNFGSKWSSPALKRVHDSSLLGLRSGSGGGWIMTCSV